MTNDPETPATTTATLTLWRVFGLADNFGDRPQPYWMTDAAMTSFPTDRIAVTIGNIPDELFTTLRQWRARARGHLSALVGLITSAEQPLQMYHEDLATVQIPEFETDPYIAWLTVRVTRSIILPALDDGELNWGPDLEQIVGALQKFEEEGNRALDCTLAAVIGASDGLNVRHLRYSDRRPFITAPGKAALTIPRLQGTIKDSGITVGRNDGWITAPVDEIAAAVSSVASISITKNISKLIAQPMSWLSSAMGEEEDDIRRFTFAFAGLELLVTQVEKNHRDTLVSTIESLDSNLPMADLLWPSTNADFVWRNLVFRFAATAVLYSPDTAKDDLGIFKPIARARNDMFHGSEQTITRELSIACTGLLKKYVGLVAKSLGGTETQ